MFQDFDLDVAEMNATARAKPAERRQFKLRGTTFSCVPVGHVPSWALMSFAVSVSNDDTYRAAMEIITASVVPEQRDEIALALQRPELGRWVTPEPAVGEDGEATITEPYWEVVDPAVTFAQIDALTTWLWRAENGIPQEPPAA